MSDMIVDMRNVRFLLYEVLDVESLTKATFYEDHSKETFEMALEAAYQLAREVCWPAFQEMDAYGVQFDGAQTKVSPAMHEIWRQCKEGGWFAPSAAYEDGGQQFPYVISTATKFLFCGANSPAEMYISGARGVAYLVELFGTPEQKSVYVEKCNTGEWAGTMALTEPQAGTSLGDITTTAVKAPDGDHYLIQGTKRFISSGDHDLAENIIHPTLARIKGAPAGTKGISLFLIPKYRPNADGSAGEFNDVKTGGVEHKLGLRGQATATLNFGEKNDCHGTLLGAENEGLRAMFKLMNVARISTGLQALSGASTAYQCALSYAKERVQGRAILDRDPATPQIPILGHADVRHMLLQQKAFVEGMLGVIFYAANLVDEIRVAETEEEKARTLSILEVLTPCIKAHGSDGSFESIRLAMQVYGGVGYCEEYPIAQLLRDSKVYSIYEGTNGVQALDLLGRKVVMNNGEALRLLGDKMDETLATAKSIEALGDLVASLEELKNEVVATTMHLAAVGLGGDPELYVANATDYLEMFSKLVVCWQLLVQAIVAQQALDAGSGDAVFYESKLATARFYFRREVPHALATGKIIQSDDRIALDAAPEAF